MNKNKCVPKVSVIILNYNGMQYLSDCFEVIKKNTTYPNYEVIMVDNNSTDGSVDFVSTHHPWVIIIQTGENRGFAAGNNVGIKKTESDYVFLLNNDTIPQPKWLSRVVETAESDPNIGIVGALPVHMDLYNFYRRPHSFNRLEEVSEVAGATMLIKRELLNNIGLLDEYSFLYWEDTEFCWRAILAGYKVFVDYDAVVYHHLGGSSGEKPLWIYEKRKNEIYTYLKLFDPMHAIYFSSISIIRGIGLIVIHPRFARHVINAFVDTFKNRRYIMRNRREFKSMKTRKSEELVRTIKRTRRIWRRDEKYWKD